MGEDEKFGFGYFRLVLSTSTLHGVEERGIGWRYKCETRHILVTWQGGSLVEMAKGVIKDRKEVTAPNSRGRR